MIGLALALLMVLGGRQIISSLWVAKAPSLSARLIGARQIAPVRTSPLSRFRFSAAATLSSKRRLQQALFELPEIIELLNITLAAGESLYSALRRIVPRASGILAQELDFLLRSLDLGSDLESELENFAKRIPQRQVVEFANKLALALRRGTPLVRLMREQADSVRAEVNQQLLSLAGRNETRMLIPLVFLILPITVLFAVYPSLQLLNLNYL